MRGVWPNRWLGLTWQVPCEERVIKFVHSSWLQRKTNSLEHLDERVSINKLNRRRSVAVGFLTRVGGKCPRRYNDSFIRPSDHGVAKVAYLSPGYCSVVSLALE